MSRYINQSNNNSTSSNNYAGSFNRPRGSHQIDVGVSIIQPPKNSMPMSTKAANNDNNKNVCAYHSPKNSLKYYTNMSL